MDDSRIQDIALIMAVNCVRNTIIEDYHVGGKLSDEDMKNFNKEVANKLYTFLKIGLFSENLAECQRFLNAMGMMYPQNWDKPVLDKEIMETLKLINKSEEKRKQFSQ